MSEFCRKCSLELFDSQIHDEPCFCEGCAEFRPVKSNIIKNFKEKIGKVFFYDPTKK